MIPSPLSRCLTAVACGALFATPCAARTGYQPTTETKSLHEWATFGALASGSSIGIEPLSIKTGSSVSIFLPWDSGAVDLTALLRSGTTRGAIDVSVTGYAPGAYTVSAVTESSNSTVVLGSLTVTSGSLPIVTGSGPIPLSNAKARDKDAVAASPAFVVLEPWGLSSGHAYFGGRRNPFPDGFNPFDVATVSVSDSNGDVISTATLTPVPNGFYNAVSPLASGTSAPGATGTALIRASASTPIVMPMAQTYSVTTGSIWGGPVPVVPPIIIDPLPPIFFNPTTGQLAIHAHGLPASARLTYAADGTDLGTATTDASGNFNAWARQGNGGSLPSTLDLFSVTTITVTDASGNVLVSAGF